MSKMSYAEAPQCEVCSDASTINIRFDIGRLAAIEKALGKTVNEITFDDFADLMIDSTDFAAASKTFRRVSATRVIAFVGACTGHTAEEVTAKYSLGAVREAFGLLAITFIKAVLEFNGLGPRDPQDNPQAPGTEGNTDPTIPSPAAP